MANAAPEETIVDGVTYHILRASADSVRILWKASDGRQLRTFPDVARKLERDGLTVDTLMNGGILDGDLSQVRSGSDIAKPSSNFGSIIAVIKTDEIEGAAEHPTTRPESR